MSRVGVKIRDFSANPDPSKGCDERSAAGSKSRIRKVEAFTKNRKLERAPFRKRLTVLAIAGRAAPGPLLFMPIAQRLPNAQVT
jgi:hypothetical protein